LVPAFLLMAWFSRSVCPHPPNCIPWIIVGLGKFYIGMWEGLIRKKMELHQKQNFR
jgi:hypothetical protein